jgi:hypothetical protein
MKMSGDKYEGLFCLAVAIYHMERIHVNRMDVKA